MLTGGRDYMLPIESEVIKIKDEGSKDMIYNWGRELRQNPRTYAY